MILEIKLGKENIIFTPPLDPYTLSERFGLAKDLGDLLTNQIDIPEADKIRFKEQHKIAMDRFDLYTRLVD